MIKKETLKKYIDGIQHQLDCEDKLFEALKFIHSDNYIFFCSIIIKNDDINLYKILRLQNVLLHSRVKPVDRKRQHFEGEGI